MFLDNSLAFSTSWTTADAITTTADSSNVIDVTGAGAGNAPAMVNSFPASHYQSLFSDYGGGDGIFVPYFYACVTVAGTGSGTITFSVSAAPDDGSTYNPGTYTQLIETKAFVGTALTLGGVIIIPLPPTLYTLGEALPRFYKETYTVSGTAGASVISGLVTNPQEALLLTKYNNNFLAV